MIVTLLTARPIEEVRAALGSRADRFTRRGASPLVELYGQLRADGEGTRLVADARTRSLMTAPPALLLALLVFVSFSEPLVFVAVAVVFGALGVGSPRVVGAYRAERRRLLDGLVRDLDAAELPARERGRPRR